MPDENLQGLDANKVAAEVIGSILKDFAKTASSTVTALGRKIIDAIKKDLNSYLVATIARCSRVKTILHREEPADFGSLYVNQNLKCRTKHYTDREMPEVLFQIKSAIVEGTAGSGKSMFMRYLFLTLCRNTNGKIPLFIELRQINTFQTKDLLALIYHTIVTGGVITQDQFNDGLKHGLFVIIFDGFDEVDFDQRSEIEKQLLNIRERFPNLIIIVTSRPDERFHAWPQFYVFSVLPMVKEQVASLIQKLGYDKDTTGKFLKSLDGLFKTHSTFLSNPLLAIMMLITFDQYAHIPDKLHIFYEHAFEALFSRHDASKPGVYKRKTYTGLPIDDFRNCLASFCIATYAKEMFHFSSGEVRKFLQKALNFEGNKKVKVEDFLNDLLESVCVLQRDGLDIAFTHRSFQEYFSALFITRNPSTPIEILLNQISRRSEDHVLSMAFDMNRNLIESSWVIPKLRELNRKVASLDLNSNLFEYLTALYGPLTIHFDRDVGFGLLLAEQGRRSPGTYFIFSLYELYPDAFGRIRRNLNNTRKKDRELAKEIKKTFVAQNRLSSSRQRALNAVPLQQSDTEWLSQSSHFAYFNEQQKALSSLLDQLEARWVDREQEMGELFSL